MTTPFDYKYQNPSGFAFLMLIRAIVVFTSLGIQNLNMKRKTNWIVVVVVKWRHRENCLLQPLFWLVTEPHRVNSSPWSQNRYVYKETKQKISSVSFPDWEAPGMMRNMPHSSLIPWPPLSIVGVTRSTYWSFFLFYFRTGPAGITPRKVIFLPLSFG